MGNPSPADPASPSCAFDFFPAAYSTAGKALMGLQAANEGFLRAFLRHGRLPRCVAQVRGREEEEAFTRLVREICGADQPVDCLRPDDLAGLADVGALLHPFPGFGPLAWNRNFAAPAAYSLLGITHTTAAQEVMDSIGNLAFAPIQPWDAVVCTSTAVRHTYETVLDTWEEYLRQRLGARRLPRPQLPIIPLGVDTSSIRPPTPEERQRIRQELAIPTDAFVVLWVGRLNPVAKAHPIPAYLALERLARNLDRSVVYLQSGWYSNDQIAQAFQSAAQRWAPSVRHVVVDGREPAIRQRVWHAGDVFLSLSDNLQETFGLTPIEAMAAELPVVVSDWDGYRDTVREGIDGFCIPTAMPAPGLGTHLALPYCAGTLPYELYCGVSCQSVAVDVGLTARALEDLARNPALCRQFGSAGRRRALQRFDWAVVIRQYQELLVELAGRRRSACRQDPGLLSAPSLPAPLRADPYTIFASYASQTLDLASGLWLSEAWQPGDDGSDEQLWRELQQLHNSPLFHFGAPWRLPLERTRTLLMHLAVQPGQTVQEVAEQLQINGDSDAFNRLVATVGWLRKLGLVSCS